MKRKRNGLVPIGEVCSGLGGPVKEIREASPQALHHFTRFDQVNQLVEAGEADPDMGFMARLLALCSLPRTNPGNRLQYKRVNGPYKLIMIAGGDNKLPFGNVPRLLLAWLCTEAVRTKSRELVLGRSLSEFMGKVGMASVGGARTRLRNQMKRLFRCQIELIHKHEHGDRSIASRVADRTEFWWNERKPNERTLWDSKDPAGRRFLPGDRPSPRAAGLEYPQSSVTLSAGPRSLPVGGLPHLHAEAPDSPLLAASLPPVRSGPRQSGRQPHRPGFSERLPARVEEDQDRLAGPELLHAERGASALPLETRHYSEMKSKVSISDCRKAIEAKGHLWLTIRGEQVA